MAAPARVPVFEPGFQASSLRAASAVTPEWTVPEPRSSDAGGQEPSPTSYGYTAHLRRDWCIGFVPHGGYLTTVLLTASTHAFTHAPALLPLSQPHAIHTSLTFFRRAAIGDAHITITPIKTGRQYSFVRAVLTQPQNGNGGEEVCLEAIITHANIDTELSTGVNLATPSLKHLVPSKDECEFWPAPAQPAATFRPASAKMHYWVPRPAAENGSTRFGKSVREQWVQLASVGSESGPDDRFGLEALGYVCDMFVPLPENYPETRSTHWYPTLSLSLDVKKAPPPAGWEYLFVRIESKVIAGGRMDIDVTVFGEDTEVVAVSRHVAIVVDIKRNNSRAKI